MTLEEAKGKAQEAERLLENPLLQEAFSATSEALISAISIAKTPEEAFKATLSYQQFLLVRDCIRSYIASAKVMEFNSRKSFVDTVLGR